MSAPRGGPPAPEHDEAFTATRWSVVLAARDADSTVRSAALEHLCQTYWRAVHAFARQRTPNPEDARDLTQSFFAAFLDGQGFARADPARGRFRTFLLHSVQNFISNERRKAEALKRGGGVPIISLDAQPAEAAFVYEVEPMTPEQAYENRWALTTLEQAVVRLQAEYEAAGKGELFGRLRSSLWDEPGSSTYAEIGEKLKMSEAAVKMAVSRMRTRARDMLRRAVADTVASPAEIEEEFQHLLAVIRR